MLWLKIYENCYLFENRQSFHVIIDGDLIASDEDPTIKQMYVGRGKKRGTLKRMKEMVNKVASKNILEAPNIS